MRIQDLLNASSESPVLPSLSPATRQPPTSPVTVPAVSKAYWERGRYQRPHIAPKRFHCNICGTDLTTKQNLNFHIDAHYKIRRYECQFCNRRFGTPHVRKRHQAKCEKNNGASEVSMEVDVDDNGRDVGDDADGLASPISTTSAGEDKSWIRYANSSSDADMNALPRSRPK